MRALFISLSEPYDFHCCLYLRVYDCLETLVRVFHSSLESADTEFVLLLYKLTHSASVSLPGVIILSHEASESQLEAPSGYDGEYTLLL